MLITNLRFWFSVLLLTNRSSAQSLPKFTNQTTYSAGNFPYSVKTSDLNGDNTPDIVVANYGSSNVGVFLNMGNGTLANQTTYSTSPGSAPHAVSVADINLDSKPDIIVADSNLGSINILYNLGEGIVGNRSTYSTGSGSVPSSVYVADVNLDSKPDIIVADYGSNDVSILLNVGNGTFNFQTTYSTGSMPISIIVTDLNLDSNPDIIVANNGSNNIAVFLSLGTTGPATSILTTDSTTAGTVTSSSISTRSTTTSTSSTTTTSTTTNSNTTTSFNAIIVTTTSTTISVSTATTDTTTSATTSTTTDITSSTTATDTMTTDGTSSTTTTESTSATTSATTTTTTDNTSDTTKTSSSSTTSTTSTSSTVTVTGQSSVLFTTQMVYATDISPYSVTTSDLNGDNVPDIVVANYGSGNVGVFLNMGNGTFANQTTYSTGPGSAPHAVSVADINLDSKPDIIVADSNLGSINILYNLGNGIFGNRSTYSTGSGSVPSSVYVADVNLDSKPDIIVGNRGVNNVGVFLWLKDIVTTTTTTTLTSTTTVIVNVTMTIVSASITSTSSTTTDTTTTTTTTTTAATNTTMSSISTGKNCMAPVITLIPNASSLSVPVEFQRSQAFSIVSNIELSCNSSLSTKMKWIISNCNNSSCPSEVQIDQAVITTFSELFIPAWSLAYGTYELKLTVTMTASPNSTSSASIYVKIIASSIQVNLAQFGTSMITQGYQQNLTLNPGKFSIDPDTSTFNASNWEYTYYCRIYGLYGFPSMNGTQLPIDDPRINSLSSSCFSNRSGNETAWKYDSTVSSKSAVSILARSLASNQTYQFMVNMVNRENPSIYATGYLLVKIQDQTVQIIDMGCVVSTMCKPNMEYQSVNPTTQVALFSVCNGDCSSLLNVKWNIYEGSLNSSSNTIQWTQFNSTLSKENIWFFGMNTSNSTSTIDLFLQNPQIQYWSFEVIYSFPSRITTSSLNFLINQLPFNGSCSISPLNGTTSTPFNISCLDWFDEDGIKDYTIYAWDKDPTEQMIIAYSTVPMFQVLLPAGNNQTTLLHLTVYIRDQMDCTTVLNLSSVSVISDTIAVTNLINDIQSSSNRSTTNSIIQLLASGNQNLVGQVLTSVSQQLNQMNDESLDRAVSYGIPITSISISSLEAQHSGQQIVSLPVNQSVIDELQTDLNSRAVSREYLIAFTSELPITTSNSIKLQASSLVQLTKSINELTRTTLTIASDRCYQLGITLNSMKTRIPFEDVQTTSTDLLRCATNLLSAVNGPLQQRTTVLNVDSSRASSLPEDYDTDLELDWANPNLFADGDDFSWETIQKNRNIYYQKQLANQINVQMTKLITF
ncbi:unnamed protein product, partial [Adineta ricciae]